MRFWWCYRVSDFPMEFYWYFSDSGYSDDQRFRDTELEIFWVQKMGFLCCRHISKKNCRVWSVDLSHVSGSVYVLIIFYRLKFLKISVWSNLNNSNIFDNGQWRPLLTFSIRSLDFYLRQLKVVFRQKVKFDIFDNGGGRSLTIEIPGFIFEGNNYDFPAKFSIEIFEV